MFADTSPGASAMDNESEERTRTYSDKGQVDLYHLERLSEHFEKLSKHGVYIIKLIDNEASFEVVKSSYSTWMSEFELYLERHHDYMKRLPHEKRDEYVSVFEERDEQLMKFKGSVEKYFSTAKSASKPKQSKSVKGTGSIKSNSSRQSVISMKRLIEEQKKAELETKLAALEKKKKLAKAKLEIKLEEEELELSTGIAVAVAKSKVFDKFEGLSVSESVESENDSQSPDVCDHDEDQNLVSTLNPAATPFQMNNNTPVVEPVTPMLGNSDTPQPSNVVECTNDNANVNIGTKGEIHSVVQHLRKPTPEIKKFSGSVVEFRKFIRKFNAKVCANTDDYDERMSYLEQYTTGEANKVVSGFSHLEGRNAYVTTMAQLEERYGNKEVIAAAYSKKALNWPSIKPGDGKSLDEFALFLVESQNAMDNIGSGSILEFSENIRTMVTKLPFNLHDRWRTVVLKTKENGNIVKFSQFVKFVKEEAKKVNDPIYGNEALGSWKPKAVSQETKTVKPGKSVKASHAGVIKDKTDSKCTYCGSDSHELADCESIMSVPLPKRCEHVRKHGLCFGCLKKGHLSKSCKKRSTCKLCGRKHPTILHDESRNTSTAVKSVESEQASDVGKTSGSVNCLEDLSGQTGAGDISCAMAIIPVKVKLKNKAMCIDTYAFFDSGSSVSFCTEDIMHRLGGSGKKMQVTLNTMGTPHKLNTYSLQGLQVCDLDMNNVIDMPNVYTKEEMPVSDQHIPKREELSKWPHLSDIEMPVLNTTIGIMIGNNVPDAYTPLEVVTGSAGSPHATKTRLGWIVWNLVRNSTESDVMSVVNKAEISAFQEHCQLEHLLRESFNSDFPERLIDDKKENSLEDKDFLSQVDTSIYLEEGHFMIDLPFRDQSVQLPDNVSQARQRLNGLKAKFQKNPKFHADYIDFMTKIINEGHAEIVPEDQLKREDGKVWYLPHHGIYHPKKPNKVRVVFDCSATFSGISLNSLLLQGPDLSNNLLGVLLRFREEPVAILGDIESMFHQVKVPPKDRDCLRFLWWPVGDIEKEPDVLRMTVHLFGATSSPSCCNFALKHTAKVFGSLFEPQVPRTLSRDMYVDDCLTSVATEDAAIDLVTDLGVLCKKGGFRLTKWVSNKPSVVAAIPENERGSVVKHLDVKSDHPIERALGVCWFVDSDRIGFSIQLKDQPATRRGILSVVSSIYDPLGIASPFVLVAKGLLQKLCKKEIGWDDPIDDEDQQVWSRWLAQAKELENVSIERCYKPEHFGKIVSTEIHCFGDASNIGYGMVFYIRLVNDQGRIHCSFLLGKSRVAPLKTITVPRLELTASSRAVRLCKRIADELSLEPDRTFFWTDSMSVLRYIANRNARFHTFVANRLAVIHESTSDNQWKFVDTKQNPADIASRGMDASQFSKNSEWLHGPEFLWKCESEWPECPLDKQLPSDDAELKKVVNSVTLEKSGMDGLISYFSTWNKLKRITAWILKYMQTLKDRIEARKSGNPKCELSKIEMKDIHLTAELLQTAEHRIVRYVQQQNFPEEYELLQKSSCSDLDTRQRLKKTSKLYKLDAFMKDGLLRLGGRLDTASIPFEAKHPVILPKDSRVSHLIIENIHRSIGHLGKNSILAVLRQNYSVIGASSIIKGLVSRCVICRKYQGRPSEQKMANLPEERLVADEPPFSRVGIDYFGPFFVKRGRSQIKRYGVIFTCLSSRAVHLEVAYSLNTDSCVDALRRFIARRGVPKFIRTDNGTNFIGAERELREEVAKFNQSRINNFLVKQNIRWEFNPPAASHFGGVWERLIRSVRKVFYSVMHEQIVHLDDEGLHTLFCEVECILNGRPLTEQPNPMNDLDVLTPNHLLLLRPGESFPPGTFQRSDNYVQRRWRQIQYLADLFWKRWTKEYLLLLQVRQKWNNLRENIQVGDIVLIVENTPRNVWSLGKVIEVLKDKSGCVRVVRLRTVSGVLTRPITKVCKIMDA